LAYCSTCSAFVMDLPVPSFVFHSSLLTVKSIDLVVARRWLITEIVCIFHSGYLHYRGAFQTVLVLLCNKLKIADREGKWILQFQTITGMRTERSYFFLNVVTLITEVVFEQLLIHTAVYGVNIAEKEP